MKKFKKIYIEITNTCNMSCDFCPKTRREASFMSEELFELTLNNIKGRSKNIYFHIMGEPLLHPKIGLFLEMAATYGFKVNITTNGTLIKNLTEAILSKAALRQVNFSLHSFEANIIKYPMHKYLDDIFEFVKESKKVRELLISLRLWNLSDDGKNKSNHFILNRIKEEFELSDDIEQKLTPCNGIRIADYVFLHQANIFDWPDLSLDIISDNGFCYGLRDQIGILVDGTVVPCCLDGEACINLGNIKEQGFDEIVEGKRAQALYNGFSGRKAVEELCKRCGYKSRFDISE